MLNYTVDVLKSAITWIRPCSDHEPNRITFSDASGFNSAESKLGLAPEGVIR